jgi:hypothetical protein
MSTASLETVPLPFQPPDSIPIHDFLFGEAATKHGRYPPEKSKPPFTCGVTGKSYTVQEVSERFESLARALSSDLQWNAQYDGDEMDRVAAFYSLNTVRGFTWK